MKTDAPSYHGYRFPPEIISHAVWLYHRFCVSFRDVEELLAQRGITVSYEAIRVPVKSMTRVCRSERAFSAPSFPRRSMMSVSFTPQHMLPFRRKAMPPNIFRSLIPRFHEARDNGSKGFEPALLKMDHHVRHHHHENRQVAEAARKPVQ